jgi:hypothetical protein
MDSLSLLLVIALGLAFLFSLVQRLRGGAGPS